MFSSAGRAVQMIFEPALFGVVFKSFALSFLIFALLFLGAEYAVQQLPTLHWHWLNVALQLLVPVLVIVLAFVLGAPVAAIFASLYLNGIASAIEAKYYGNDTPSPGAPFFASFVVVLRVLAWVVLLTLALLPVDVTIPILGSLAALVGNGWLLGREYFELTALRHLPRDQVDAMRRRHGAAILGAGLVIAALAEIPVVNFIAPLYGAAFMVHVFKHFQHRECLA
ncbi:MAG: EI24 domain-containing protein [Rhizomicrobium sp.]|jgi:CysZ protein